MTLYDAIMKAADHIEQNPDLFQYNRNGVPECGAPGCALGWVGVMLNEQPSISFGQTLPRRLGHSNLSEFLRAFAKCAGVGYTTDAKVAAAGLRKYAQQYHAVAAPSDPFPAWLADLKAWLRRSEGTYRRS